MKSAFDLKSARLEALTLRLFTADLAEIAALLDEKAAQYAQFAHMPFVLDATHLKRADEAGLGGVGGFVCGARLARGGVEACQERLVGAGENGGFAVVGRWQKSQ